MTAEAENKGAIHVQNVKPSKMFGMRHVMAVLLFAHMAFNFMVRVNLSVAIVAMTSTTQSNATTFDWSTQLQSIILSSFFWGYVLLQVPGGEMSAKFGGKPLLTVCLGVNGIVTLLLPLTAYYVGWQGVCGIRVIQGLSQGFLMPSIHNVLGKWIPLEEKTRLGSLVYAGQQVGTAAGLLLSGLLSNTAIGWPIIFYLFGCCLLVLTVFWIWLGASSPDESRYISDEELKYIHKSLGTVSGSNKKLSTPWKALFTSLPFWALIIVHCGQNWGFWTLLTEMPSYMSQVLGVDIAANGVLSALPYLCMALLSFPFGYISDKAIAREWASVTTMRKIFNSIGHWGPAIALIFLSYTPAGNVPIAALCLTITVALNAGYYAGYVLVHIDMAPNFAGTMMGITNGVANLISIMAPLAVGLILEDETDASEWRVVFFISSGIYFVGNLFFVIFGSSQRQPWNEPNEESKETSDP